MKQVDAEVSDQSQVASGDLENKDTQEVQSEVRDDKVSYETHRKLLGEKKKVQSEAEAMKAELEKLRQQDLEQKGKQAELIESLRKQLAEKDKSLLNVKTNYTMQSLNNALIAEGTKQGCLDLDLLLKSIDISGIEINDDFTVNQDDLQRAVSEAAIKKPILFRKKVSSVKDGVPNGKAANFSGQADLKKLKAEDLKNLLAMKLGK